MFEYIISFEQFIAENLIISILALGLVIFVYICYEMFFYDPEGEIVNE